ncbi:hypothetical protein [Thiohalorhabdus sp.]|uniref:hypothetical protein n=1 Tax=Thiohalorhabdus sp. TaxID=3094134 RepID=UPI002FC3BF1C
MIDLTTWSTPNGRKIRVMGAGATTALLIAAAMSPVHAADFEVHGDLNHRFEVFNNQDEFFNGFNSGGDGVIRDDDEARDGNFADVKYRLWTEISPDDDRAKGIVALELGGIRFGDEDDGGAFSGDAENVETRWAYGDFALPWAPDHRLNAGLQPHAVNQHVWGETAAGVTVKGPLSDTVDYSLAWMRGDDATGTGNNGRNDGFDSADGFSLNLDADLSSALQVGVFGLFQRNDQNTGSGVVDATEYEVKSISDSEYELWTVGTDGRFNMPMGGGGGFARWDLILQSGDIDDVAFESFDSAGTGGTNTGQQNFDLNAFFGRLDLGYETGAKTYTYTFWYSSGDDAANDDDFDAFMATDVDTNDSMIFFENMTDDNFFAETPYLLDKGFMLNKFQVDHRLTPNVELTGLASYHRLAADVQLGNGDREDELGVELGGRISYEPTNQYEIASEVAYLLADDAMDAFEADPIKDGASDEDLWHFAARIRYKF